MSEAIDYGAKGNGETRLIDIPEGESFDQARARIAASGLDVVDAGRISDREGTHTVVEVRLPIDEEHKAELIRLGHGPVEEQRAA